MPEDPAFLSRTQVDEAHRVSLQRYGGIAGVRNESGVESALNAPLNDYFYAGADLFGIAAAYALVFLEGNGVPTDTADSFPLHEALIAVTERRMTKAELAGCIRELFGGKPSC